MSVFSVGYVLILGVMWAAMWSVGNRRPGAWLVLIGARVGLIVWSTLMRVPAIVPISAAFVLVDWRNYVRWRKERAMADKVAAFIEADDESLGSDEPVGGESPDAIATSTPPAADASSVAGKPAGSLTTLGGKVIDPPKLGTVPPPVERHGSRE